MEQEKLISSLNAHQVDFVVIGAAAFPVHGYARATLDVDIYVRPSPDNIQRCMAALRAFGFDLGDLTEDDFRTKKVLIRQYIVECDVHPFVKGVKDFDEVWTTKVASTFGDEPCFFASLDALIAMKRAAGRPKDVQDLAALELLKSST